MSLLKTLLSVAAVTIREEKEGGKSSESFYSSNVSGNHVVLNPSVWALKCTVCRPVLIQTCLERQNLAMCPLCRDPSITAVCQAKCLVLVKIKKTKGGKQPQKDNEVNDMKKKTKFWSTECICLCTGENDVLSADRSQRGMF